MTRFGSILYFGANFIQTAPDCADNALNAEYLKELNILFSLLIKDIKLTLPAQPYARSYLLKNETNR